MNQTMNANSNRTLSHDQIVHLVLTAMFIAVILLLGLTPIGLIPLPLIKVTILGVPVVAGTLLLGLKSGLVLGFCFGTVSAMSAFGIAPLVPPSALVATLVAANPVLTVVMCYLPRLMVPVVTHMVYRIASGGKPERSAVVPLAAAAGSLTNTVLYLGLMLFFFVILGLDAASVIGVITGTGIIAGGLEAVVAAVISTPVLTAIWKVQKTRG